MKAYYLHNGKERTGPFSISDLQKKEISSDTLVWHKGLENWIMAGELEELRYIIQATPPKMKAGLVPPPVPTKETVPEKKRSKAIVWLLLLLVLAGIGGFWYYQDSHNALSKEREKEEQAETVKEELADKEKAKIRNNIRRYITLKRSAYNSSSLGGISNLSITLTNNTKYLVDDAKVEIHYIKSNGEIHSTEYLDFHLVGPHSKMTLKAPDSKRGIRVEQTLVEVKSEALGL